MFDSASRYAGLENATMTSQDGTTIVYKKRRFLPQTKTASNLFVIIKAGDRLDTMTARTIGDPEQFWRVCDANNAMYPPKLTQDPGKSVSIPLPGR